MVGCGNGKRLGEWLAKPAVVQVYMCFVMVGVFSVSLLVRVVKMIYIY